jgi:hypothetical protein
MQHSADVSQIPPFDTLNPSMSSLQTAVSKALLFALLRSFVKQLLRVVLPTQA